jgi:hypothetical protein
MRIRDRIPRPKGKCTICGEELPEKKEEWGLDWHDDSGACVLCLHIIRESLGCSEHSQDSPLQET